MLRFRFDTLKDIRFEQMNFEFILFFFLQQSKTNEKQKQKTHRFGYFRFFPLFFFIERCLFARLSFFKRLSTTLYGPLAPAGRLFPR